MSKYIYATSDEDDFIEEKEVVVNKNYLEVAYDLYIEGNINHMAYYKRDENLKKSLFSLKTIKENENFILNEFRVNTNPSINEPKISFSKIQDERNKMYKLIEEKLKWSDEDIRKKLSKKIFKENSLGGMLSNLFKNSPALKAWLFLLKNL